jgi:hypothetical protein
MASGIQGLRRLEMRDEHGDPCALLIGYTESRQLVIGVVPASGDTLMAVVEVGQPVEVFELMRAALRGELP